MVDLQPRLRQLEDTRMSLCLGNSKKFAGKLGVLDLRLHVDFSAIGPTFLAIGMPDNYLNLTCLPQRHITAFSSLDPLAIK